MQSAERRVPCRLMLLLATLGAMVTAEASAQMPLAWKLKAGDKFALHVEQQTASTVTVASKTTKTTVEMNLDSEWTVESIVDQSAQVRQTIVRAQMKVQAADAPPVVYDSAAAAQPSGAARDLAAALAPLLDTGSSIQFTMSPRGEISAVELSPSLAAAFEKGSPAASSVQALLKQPLVVLPEKEVSVGETWNLTRELATPLGQFTQATEYKLGQPQDPPSSGATINYSATLAPLAATKAKLTEQSHTGTVLFDQNAGRFLSGQQSQTLTTETPYREATIRVVVQTEVKRTLTPRP